MENMFPKMAPTFSPPETKDSTMVYLIFFNFVAVLRSNPGYFMKYVPCMREIMLGLEVAIYVRHWLFQGFFEMYDE